MNKHYSWWYINQDKKNRGLFNEKVTTIQTKVT